MTFRTIQGLTLAALLGTWAVRSLSHPGFHPMLLVFAFVALGISEVSFRAGKAQCTGHVGEKT